jgi:hypothetical protein
MWHQEGISGLIRRFFRVAHDCTGLSKAKLEVLHWRILERQVHWHGLDILYRANRNGYLYDEHRELQGPYLQTVAKPPEEITNRRYSSSRGLEKVAVDL